MANEVLARIDYRLADLIERYGTVSGDTFSVPPGMYEIAGFDRAVDIGWLLKFLSANNTMEEAIEEAKKYWPE